MSYEGDVEYLCEKGHRFDGPCTYGNEPDPNCFVCGGPPVWQHAINHTNCDAIGYIPDHIWDKFQIAKAESEVCSLGHTHITVHPRYRQPTAEELREMEHYWDDEQQAYMPLRKPK